MNGTLQLGNFQLVGSSDKNLDDNFVNIKARKSDSKSTRKSAALKSLEA